VLRNLFSPAAHLNLSKDTWRHTTRFRLTKRGFKTIHGHKYEILALKECRHMKTKHNTCWIKLSIMNQCVCVCVYYEFQLRKTKYCLFRTITCEYTISCKNSRHTWNLAAAHRLRNTGLSNTSSFPLTMKLGPQGQITKWARRLVSVWQTCRIWQYSLQKNIKWKRTLFRNPETRRSKTGHWRKETETYFSSWTEILQCLALILQKQITSDTAFTLTRLRNYTYLFPPREKLSYL
jgi:hypothetical protein